MYSFVLRHSYQG